MGTSSFPSQPCFSAARGGTPRPRPARAPSPGPGCAAPARRRLLPRAPLWPLRGRGVRDVPARDGASAASARPAPAPHAGVSEHCRFFVAVAPGRGLQPSVSASWKEKPPVQTQPLPLFPRGPLLSSVAQEGPREGPSRAEPRARPCPARTGHSLPPGAPGPSAGRGRPALSPGTSVKAAADRGSPRREERAAPPEGRPSSLAPPSRVIAVRWWQGQPLLSVSDPGLVGEERE